MNKKNLIFIEKTNSTSKKGTFRAMIQIIIILSLSVFSTTVFSFENPSEFGVINQISRVGDCHDVVFNDSWGELNHWTQSQCPNQDYQYQINANDFANLLFGLNGIFTNKVSEDEREWILKDANYLFHRIVNADLTSSFIKTPRQLTQLLSELEDKHSFRYSMLYQAFQANSNLIQCLKPYALPKPWLSQTSKMKDDTYYYNGDLLGFYSEAFYSVKPEFKQLLETDHQGVSTEFHIPYSSDFDQGIYLWLVDSCGLAFRQKINPKWNWQPSFQSILSRDINGDTYTDAIDLHSVDLVDSLKNWQSIEVINTDNQEVILKTENWIIIDSNNSIVRVLFNQELTDELQGTLKLHLQTTHGTREHIVQDGVAPALREAKVVKKNLRLKFSEEIVVSSTTLAEFSLFFEGFEFKPQSISHQTSESIIVTPPSYLNVKPGDSIRVDKGLVDRGASLPVSKNIVMVSGQINANMMQSKVRMKALNARPKNFSNKKLNNYKFSLDAPKHFKNQPLMWIDILIPPDTTKNPSWNFVIDIFDHSGQVVLNQRLTLSCDEINLNEIHCDKSNVLPFWVSLPWNMRSSDQHLAAIGAYILQIKIQTSTQVVLNKRYHFGLTP